MRHVNQMKIFLLMAIGAFTLSSCLKGGEPTEIHVARVAFLNAIPSSEGVDVALDNNLVNNSYSDNPDFAYGDTLAYVNAFPGQRWVRVFDPERGFYEAPLAQATINLTPGEAYTIYVVGHDEIGLVASADKLGEPESGNAKIRFINLSPDAPSLDFGIRGADGLIGNDKEFKEYSDFVEIDAGEAHTFDITLHGSDDLTHSFSLSLEEGGMYTIWAKGLFSDAPEATFGHGVMQYRTPPPSTEE